MEIKDIENLSELAKLDLNDIEKESLQKDLDGILDYVKQIEEVKVDEEEIQYPLKNIWREDEEKKKDFSREQILSQFPDSQDGFIKVKKIL
ncbi:MAG: Asp-tRNA(Asn)/Glu-tRNA(Gln) amidotransferase subunit GatC [Candidatus Paceibacterota bacterium]|jgi:aspartyl-tRNA(Asn)/glutamyl-tRNA(Gln) amidotransferase subunit C